MLIDRASKLLGKLSEAGSVTFWSNRLHRGAPSAGLAGGVWFHFRDGNASRSSSESEIVNHAGRSVPAIA